MCVHGDAILQNCRISYPYRAAAYRPLRAVELHGGLTVPDEWSHAAGIGVEGGRGRREEHELHGVGIVFL